jgi:hypothetical protein
MRTRESGAPRNTSPVSERVISLGTDLPAIPERLLLAHARGEVIFVAGAGISKPAGLPDFRELVVRVYAKLDAGVHSVISHVPRGSYHGLNLDLSGLTNSQSAEVLRFIAGDYDVVLGMLERRMDDQAGGNSRVRQTEDAWMTRLAETAVFVKQWPVSYEQPALSQLPFTGF